MILLYITEISEKEHEDGNSSIITNLKLWPAQLTYMNAYGAIDERIYHCDLPLEEFAVQNGASS